MPEDDLPGTAMLDGVAANLDVIERRYITDGGIAWLGARALRGEADAVEALGADAFVYARLLGRRGATDHGELSVVVRADGRDHPVAGSRLGVEIPSADLAVFHPQTGERIAA